MSDAKQILEMIVSVDLADTAKMDEIDARVWCYLNPDERSFIGKGKHGFEYGYDDPCGLESGVYATREKQYTRSRDALKAIRPTGWIIYDLMQDDKLNWFCTMIKKDHQADSLYESELSPTEELAELYVILRAIAYDRARP